MGTKNAIIQQSKLDFERSFSKNKMSDQKKGSQIPDLVPNELRREESLYDAVIRVDGPIFKVHKVILCSCSPVFRALFTRWTGPQQLFYTFSGLSSHTMALIIDFAYTGCLPLTKENVKDLLLAADMLLINGIVRSCFKFLVEHLCPENCIGILQLTNDVFPRSELQCSTFRYITDHFESVVPCDEFLQLTVQELAEILGRDELNVKKENTVYEAILHWIAHKPEEREEHIDVLLPKVRLALTSMQYIKRNVLAKKLIKTNGECHRVVNEAIRTIQHLIRHKSPVCAYRNPIVRPRLPTAILFAIGGWSLSNVTDSIEAYDARVNSWIEVATNLRRPHAHHGSVFLDGNIYCFGGFTGVECLNVMWRLKLSTHTWHEAAPMHCNRGFVGVALLDGNIYAIGGSSGLEELRSAERYNPTTNQWLFISDMNERRSDGGCATLNGKIYICGGFDGAQILQTAECYNPETDQWTTIADMNGTCRGAGVIALAGQVYVVGGFDGNSHLKSVEAYDPETNTWEYMSSMTIPRSSIGLEVIDGRIYAVGGITATGYSNRVEYYDRIMDKWNVACFISTSRGALSCCVVSGIPNLADYTVPRDSLPILIL